MGKRMHVEMYLKKTQLKRHECASGLTSELLTANLKNRLPLLPLVCQAAPKPQFYTQAAGRVLFQFLLVSDAGKSAG